MLPPINRKEVPMKILIDGDACSRIALTENIARQRHIPCHIYCDASRTIHSDYSEIHIVDIGFNSADMEIMKHCSKGDVVITNDIGLAAMVLVKNAYALNNHGVEFTNDNITRMMMRRHIYAATKRSSAKQKQMKQAQELLRDGKTKHPPFARTLTDIIKKSRSDR